MSSIIKIENLSKMYKLGEVGTGTLTHDLNRWFAKVRGKEDPYTKIAEENIRTGTADSPDYIWALRDINLEIEEGDVVGIVGSNGAGKSTLLKLLSQITAPTQGEIKIKGRLSSLLEIGTGFHPDMTGRENIYLNGTIMGMSKREISAKLDEIVDFSGVGTYLDTPVKRYSSGMMVRLGFAVAAHLEPDILVIDEVLAVGDAEFQKKALGKVRSLSSNQGRTVLFVSHNMTAVRSFCNKGLLIENGQKLCESDIETVVDRYLSPISAGVNNRISRIVNEELIEGFVIQNIEIDGESERNRVAMDEECRLVFKYRSDIESPHITLKFKCDDGNVIFSTSSLHSIVQGLPKGENKLTINIPANLLNSKTYTIDLLLVKDNKVITRIESAIMFTVIPGKKSPGTWMRQSEGYIRPMLDWNIRK